MNSGEMNIGSAVIKDSGHYTAYAKDPESSIWGNFNDSYAHEVSLASIQDIATERLATGKPEEDWRGRITPYILFYTKKQGAPDPGEGDREPEGEGGAPDGGNPAGR